MNRAPLLRVTSAGLYCEAGGFHIDPWSPVAKAIVTHGHADHFTAGCHGYLATPGTARILRHRLGPRAAVQSVNYGDAVDCFGVQVSLHPAGHILGSAQIRVEHQGEVWVASGDYKVAPDPTCTPFEPVRCHTFITESTFAHPFFAWSEQAAVFAEIHDWWRANQERGEASLVYAYSLGKAQRLLAGLRLEQGPVFAHPSIQAINELYRADGVALPATRDPLVEVAADEWRRAIVVLPPHERWQSKFFERGPYRTAFVSGWMALPNGPRQRRVERGFALSDHADHSSILETVAATGAETIHVTHGYIDELVDTLCRRDLNAHPLRTPRCRAPQTEFPHARQMLIPFPTA